MAELWFYHLERSELERALPPLLEKCLQRGWRALVRGGATERLDALDAILWTFRDDSFLPHAHDVRRSRSASRSAHQRRRQPQRAPSAFLIDGAEPGDISQLRTRVPDV